MHQTLTSEEMADAAQLACLLEVSAPKPGNVTRYRDFDDCRFEDFLISAIAIAPAFRTARLVPVGQTVWHAASQTRRLVGTNTNLGIVLLLAPLAKAHGQGDWRERLSQVLAELTVEDARDVYRAIRLAAPGGLGRVSEGDVAESPRITLRQAMDLAKDRDSIAREYVTDFAITFELTCPTLRAQLAGGLALSDAIVQTYLTLLAEVPDTLIARKMSRPMAEEVSGRAREVLAAGGMYSPAGRQAAEKLDYFLADEKHRLNPGTTADLVTAGLFVWIVEQNLQVKGVQHLQDMI
jgi:triphosphoribosyl-dephospho-CoA synthase